MEASALNHAARRGLLARKSPLLKLQGDEKLVAMVRAGNSGAFDTIVDRYQARLLGFCRQMIGSTEDAEDVLQEVFVNAYKAMLADNREINLRPWLYRIARNRSLNHLRKPKAVAQESMDMVPMVEAASTAEKVHNREEFRQLLQDVTKLPETQRAALLLREIDALSYEEIAEAMDTTVPSVKSLLVRARISLAEASQARMLTCGEVRVELAEAAEGLTKASGPVRRHVRDCEECAAFRKQLRNDNKALAAMMPIGFLAALKGTLAAKLGIGGSAAGTGAAGTAGAGAAGAGAGAAGAGAAGTGAAISAGTAASGIGAVTSAVGAKALAGVVTAAVITAGAVEVKDKVSTHSVADNGATTTRTVASADPVAPAVVPVTPNVAVEPELDKAAAETETPATDVPPVDPTAPATQTSDSTIPPVAHPGVDETTAPTEQPVTSTSPATSDSGDGLQGHTTYPPDEIVSETPASAPTPSAPDTTSQVPGSTPSAPVVSTPTAPVVPVSPSPAPMPTDQSGQQNVTPSQGQ
ncbi:MAG: sigma-70 family RNA polymerase sigma factor [Solirubrobacterales bacterium]|nr:sigma-70 family RNA polymerase sigma factor [Solirubrobacterales bacterium]